jgi:hypothetical protein
MRSIAGLAISTGTVFFEKIVISGRTNNPPSNAAIGMSISNASNNIAMQRGGGPIVMAIRIL